MKRLVQAAVMAGALFWGAAAWAFQDPMETPSAPSRLAARAPLMAIQKVGDHLVAVGRRGHIVVSDVGGANWTQAQVPVSVDLLALHFVSDSQGWAVGHDGVVLHSADGGKSWSKQTDGVALAQAALAHYQARLSGGDKAAEDWVKLSQGLVADGADKPLLSVWFQDALVGYVSGAFNLLFRTTDGGKSWEPLLDRVDNPQALHLYALAGDENAVYIAGEQGLLVRQMKGETRFKALETPYKGSFFGLVVRGNELLLHGMRGNAYLSSDGAANWRKLPVPSISGLNAAALGANGEIFLASQGGELLISADKGASFVARRAARPMPYFGLVLLEKRTTALVGFGGAGVETWQ
ncbi:MAG: WD40/YVTN/BNR-like repeat-containing protein [Rhodoferax sp.]